MSSEKKSTPSRRRWNERIRIPLLSDRKARNDRSYQQRYGTRNLRTDAYQRETNKVSYWLWSHSECITGLNMWTRRMFSPLKECYRCGTKLNLNREGTCCLIIPNPKNRRKYSVEFIVVKENLTPSLGAKEIQQMELIEVYAENS